MWLLYISGGIFVASIIFFANVLYGERPMIYRRLAKEILGGFILGVVCILFISLLAGERQ